MTALKISLENGKEAANKYAFGVAGVVIPQVIIAVVLTNYIAENPTILKTLEKAGIVIFLLLSYYFITNLRRVKLRLKLLNQK